MTHPMLGPNRFKLGLFSINADGGLALTRVPERWTAEWQDVATLARMADSAGLDFLLPIARWKGFGGELNSREQSMETLTFAAALAGITERIAIFSTVHVPMVHPVFAAKALATVDQASRGRAGLNIVCGWNPEEFALFGLPMIEDRYGQGREWAQIIERIYTADAPFDFKGEFYDLKNVSGKPRPVQRPRPVTLNAAFSPPGRAFAAEAADFLLTTFTDIPAGAPAVADMRQRGEKLGRTVGTMATCHVVCRPSQAEAEEYYEHYAVTMADTASVDIYTASKAANSNSHDPDAYRLYRKRFAAGAGTYPLVGTPQHIADELIRIAEAGFAGTTLSFVDFIGELPFFVQEVIPVLVRAGLRVA